jgi:hypothetical protein
MYLSETVHVARRFQRSINIDSDINSPEALTGFICPESSAAVLLSMAAHKLENNHSAFTWTGPYGSGKSSLVIALSALTDGNKGRRQEASKAVGERVSEAIAKAFPIGKQGWSVLPVIGRREQVSKTIGEALVSHGMAYLAPEGGWNDSNVLKHLENVAASIPGKAGLIVFVDEMGKFLEAAARDGTDLFFFQLLAETASRSDGKIVIVGILHQAFEEYANRLSREARDEWSKIQGRFIDLYVNTAGEEQIDLLARAIQTNRLVEPSLESQVVAECIRRNKAGASKKLEYLLENTWPLHPIVASLLGPISRRRFGQNQRSLFGFLNSAEPYGFQDFLRTATTKSRYTPDRLWDYLRVNLEPSIIASPDGHRWAMAAEGLDRCEANGGSILHSQLFKTIALLDLFRERSGLYASKTLLGTVTSVPEPELNEIIEDLKRWSLIIYRKHTDAYSVYAGSDFNIEEAIELALQDIKEVHFGTLKNLAGIQPILAKRHYFETGALRWIDVTIGSISASPYTASQFTPEQGTIGQLLLTLPTLGEDQKKAEELCKDASKRAQRKGKDVIVGYPAHAWAIMDLAKELKALEKVQEERPELQGDPVARREVMNRLILIQNQLEAELQQALLTATWFKNGKKLTRLNHGDLNNLASDIANKQYNESPKIHNELLNRAKPSSNAIAAQNALLKAMALNEGRDRLDIEGYPAEGGLFDSLLKHTRLYVASGSSYKFQVPNWANDPANLEPTWRAATKHIEENAHRSVLIREIYDIWEGSPYGIKRGLMPVLAVAFLLSRKENLAIYREGIFQARFTDLDVDYLAKDPESIQVRWMDLSNVSVGLLSGLAHVVRKLDTSNDLYELTAIDVARGLISIFDRLPAWTKRTQKLSERAKQVRTIFKNAYDPNQLLFSDLPGLIGIENINDQDAIINVVNLVESSLLELVNAYPEMLKRLSDLMLNELNASNKTPLDIAELRTRAKNIKKISGDFRVDAFIARLVNYEDTINQVEGIGSLAANKPPRDWVDTDLDKALIEIAAFARSFLRTESYARVQNRIDKRRAMSVIINRDGKSTPYHVDFEVTDADQARVAELIEQLQNTLKANLPNKDAVVLAALAELSTTYIEDIDFGKASNAAD